MNSEWMAWLNAIDAVLYTRPGIMRPDVRIHLAEHVNTTPGFSAMGIIQLPQLGTLESEILAVVSEDLEVGEHVRDHLFRGTPFGSARVLPVVIGLTLSLPERVEAQVETTTWSIRLRLEDLDPLLFQERLPTPEAPYNEHALEAAAGSARLWVCDEEIPATIPRLGPGGALPARFSPAGIRRAPGP